MPVPPELVAACRDTDFVVEADPLFVLTIGVPCPALSRFPAGVVFITPWNPMGGETSASDNEAANAELLNALRAVSPVVLPGYGKGRDGDWPPEPSFLACGIGRRAARNLGLRFHQIAIVWAGETRVPELVWCSDCPEETEDPVLSR